MKIEFPLGILTLLFIGFKLLGVVSWPWIWVLAPTWIPLSIALTLLVSVMTIAVLVGVWGNP